MLLLLLLFGAGAYAAGSLLKSLQLCSFILLVHRRCPLRSSHGCTSWCCCTPQRQVTAVELQLQH